MDDSGGDVIMFRCKVCAFYRKKDIRSLILYSIGFKLDKLKSYRV